MNGGAVRRSPVERLRARVGGAATAAIILGAVIPCRLAGACECVTVLPVNVAELYARTPHIFVGDVIRLEDLPAAKGMQRPQVAIVRVVEAIKGTIRGTVQVEDGVSGQCTAPVFSVGGLGTYVIFASGEGDYLLVDSLRSETVRLDVWNKTTLSALGRYAKRQMRKERRHGPLQRSQPAAERELGLDDRGSR
jgi:hypothetical protein